MRACGTILVLIGLVVPAVSQPSNPADDSLSEYFKFDDAPLYSCLFTYFPPVFIQHDMELKSFIRSKRFRALRRTVGDRRAMDIIFVRAMRLTNNNTAMALLLATLSSFDHRVVELRIPLFNIFFALSNESEEEFVRRLVNLPSRLFIDSPADSSADRDKLQHFFGSAFLTYIFESRASADRFGEFIENEEEDLIVGGVNDDRDRRMNREGQRFGSALLEDNHSLPTMFLRESLAHDKVSSEEYHCIGVW